jgi:23S rRNA (pseudouridine1915-N3)-methyltransferase
MRVYLYYIGKPRSAHANAQAEEYLKRCQRYARCVMQEIKPDRFDPFQRHPAASKILLDAAGQAWDSARFTALVARAEQESRDLLFLVGGADGLPDPWKPRADLLLSLSPMTFPHELARLMLAEQLYRAFTTLRRHPYALNH